MYTLIKRNERRRKRTIDTHTYIYVQINHSMRKRKEGFVSFTNDSKEREREICVQGVTTVQESNIATETGTKVKKKKKKKSRTDMPVKSTVEKGSELVGDARDGDDEVEPCTVAWVVVGLDPSRSMAIEAWAVRKNRNKETLARMAVGTTREKVSQEGTCCSHSTSTASDPCTVLVPSEVAILEP